MSNGLGMALAAARRRSALGQKALGLRAGVSASAVKSYERGERHPSRPYLAALMDAMQLPAVERDALLTLAGYAQDGWTFAPDSLGLAMDLASAQAELEQLSYPAMVLDEYTEIVCLNQVAERLFAVDFSQEYTTMMSRSVLAVASDPRIADRVLNWQEAFGTIAGVFKGHYRGGESLESDNPRCKAALDTFLAGDPRYVSRLGEIWGAVEPAPYRQRWHYRVVWDVPGTGAIDFDCVVSSCEHGAGVAYNDWIPRDAASWRVLEAATRPDASAPPDAFTP